MSRKAVDLFEQSQMKENIPDFKPGDTVKVNVKVIEGEKERIQAFEGVVIARSGVKSRETFTVRKVSYGEGVERKFPLHSPMVDSIKVVKKGFVRRAKLYYLKEKIGKAARVKDAKRKTESVSS